MSFGFGLPLVPLVHYLSPRRASPRSDLGSFRLVSSKRARLNWTVFRSRRPSGDCVALSQGYPWFSPRRAAPVGCCLLPPLWLSILSIFIDSRWCTIFLSKCLVYRLGGGQNSDAESTFRSRFFECFDMSVIGGRGVYTDFETHENQRKTESSVTSRPRRHLMNGRSTYSA